MQKKTSAAGSSTEVVTARVRELILTGVLKQGERVTEMGLAARLNVSRTPVRLALAALEQEELVEGAPNRGFWVRELTLDGMREIIEVRATLEGMAARLAAEKGMAPERERDLSDCLDTVAALIAEGRGDEATCREFSRANVLFHATISEAAGNSQLIRLLERNTRWPFRSAPMLYVLPPGEAMATIAESQRDHLRIVDAIRRGQSGRAEALMREHALMPMAKAAQLFDNINLPVALATAV